jgi:hypothetical protein
VFSINRGHDTDIYDVRRVVTMSCSVCGISASLKCAHPCQQIYCSKDCQKKDWQNHKPVCLGQSISYNVGTIMKDAIVTSVRSCPHLNQPDPPQGNSIVFIKIEDLEVGKCTYDVNIAVGADCDSFISTLVEAGCVKRAGLNHRELLERFGPEHNNQFALILRIASMTLGNVHYQLVKQDPTNTDFIVIKPYKGLCAPGFTRIAISSYDELLASELITTHFPMTLTGCRVPGSPVHAAMAEQSQNGRECAVCYEMKEHTVLSDCDHPICLECGTQWRNQSSMATCPICRINWPHFDEIYNVTNTLQFERFRCCWCGKIAKYRCGCHCYEYCSFTCKKNHADSGHRTECSIPWFVPYSQISDSSNACLKWVNGKFQQVGQE